MHNTFVEVGLSFLEGLALILSPCILPVLPLVLSASVDGGRRRPFGIIVGFVAAFTLFALFSRWLVEALHVDLEVIRWVSLVLLALLGVVMLSATLSEKFSNFTQGLAVMGGRVGQNAQGGFLSGTLIGGLIGLVWTPCAGPILAAVLVQVVRQQTGVAGGLIMAAFALGAGVPMLLIALMGRRAMQHMGFFTRHAEAVRRGVGVVIVLAAVFIASGVNIGSLLPTTRMMTMAATAQAPRHGPEGLLNGLENPYPAPAFAGISHWFNTKPLTMAGLKGKVVLVDFWTYSCINCVRTLPYITAWDKKYRDKGLVIVGVHAPEFAFEKNADNVQKAIKQHHIAYPVAMDNDLTTWDNFNNQYWPAHYLIDRQGRVVYTHFGEGDYAITERNIRKLLGLDDTLPGMAEQAVFSDNQTPETYLGYARAERFDSAEPMVRDQVASYHLNPLLARNRWALSGKWHVGPHKITAQGPGSTLTLHFYGRKVFLVMGTASGKPVTATVTLNNRPLGKNAGVDVKDDTVTVTGDTLYNLIDQHRLQAGMLTITSHDGGLEAYAFTFGS